MSLEQKIKQWLDPKLEEESLYLVDIIVSTSFKIQVFVDSLGFVTIDQCAKLSRFLEAYLDEDAAVPEKYNLEVSSPGMSNPLKVPQQYKKREGSILKIRTNDDKDLVVKVLEAFDDKFIGGLTTLPVKGKKGQKKKQVIIPDGELEKIELNYKDIKQAKLHFNF